jgi:hypothetical protein
MFAIANYAGADSTCSTDPFQLTLDDCATSFSETGISQYEQTEEHVDTGWERFFARYQRLFIKKRCLPNSIAATPPLRLLPTMRRTATGVKNFQKKRRCT